MTRTPLLLAFAVAASAGIARAETRRINFDSPHFDTPSVRDLLQEQPVPAAPPAAPNAVAAAENPAACPDGAELAGKSIRLTLKLQGEDAPREIDFAYDACRVEYPRDEPPVPPDTYRSYKSAKGDVLGVYSSSGKPTSTVSFRLADGSNAASLLPIYADADLASGRALDLGAVLLVKTGNSDRDGVVIRASGTIGSVPAK